MGGLEESGLEEVIVEEGGVEEEESSGDMQRPDIPPEPQVQYDNHIEDKISHFHNMSGVCKVQAMDAGDSQAFVAVTFREGITTAEGPAGLKHRVILPIDVAKHLRVGDSVELWIRTFK